MKCTCIVLPLHVQLGLAWHGLVMLKSKQYLVPKNGPEWIGLCGKLRAEPLSSRDWLQRAINHEMLTVMPQMVCRFLEPQYRRPLILQELLGFHADIICLQEVDEKAFAEYFLPQMQQAGTVGST